MNWDLMNKCELLFDELNIRPLLGVIPFNKDKITSTNKILYIGKNNFLQNCINFSVKKVLKTIRKIR